MISLAKKDDRKKSEAGEEAVSQEESDLVVLQDEDGQESKFKILFDSLFVGEKQYVVLMPVEEEDSQEPEIVILRVDETDDGESVLSTIDNDDEWEEVLKGFEEMDVEENLDYEIEIEDEEDDEESDPKR